MIFRVANATVWLIKELSHKAEPITSTGTYWTPANKNEWKVKNSNGILVQLRLEIPYKQVTLFEFFKQVVQMTWYLEHRGGEKRHGFSPQDVFLQYNLIGVSYGRDFF